MINSNFTRIFNRSGRKLDPFNLNEKELQEAVEEMLNDDTIRRRMKEISTRIQNGNSLELACDAIEALEVKKQNGSV